MKHSVTYIKKHQSNDPFLHSRSFPFTILAHAHFIFKMAAVQGGIVDAVETKDIKTEPSDDGGGNNNTSNNANDSKILSPPPGSSASSGSNNNTPAGTPVDQQTLLAVLQYLRKNKLTESVEILRREAGLPEDSLDLKGSDSAAAGAGGATGNADLEGADASSLLSRVTVSSSAGVQAPVKGRSVPQSCAEKPNNQKYKL